MTIQTRTIEYSHGDTLLEGFLAWDDARGAPRPGVAVAHAWGGRGEFEMDKAINWLNWAMWVSPWTCMAKEYWARGLKRTRCS